MADYRAKDAEGRVHIFEGPPGLTQADVDLFAEKYFGIPEPEFEPAVSKPQAETGFIPSIKRGFAQTGMLLGDILPAMAARAVGADQYAERQLKEAAETQADIAKKYPAAVPSFTDIKGAGDLVSYITEAVGEAIPSILPGIFTGGVASIAGRGAIIAAKQAAEKAALGAVAEGVTAEEAKNIAMKAGINAARTTALKYEATGAVTGSALQNIPDVYQNVLEATGKEDLGAALVAGSFNALLDSILPIQLLRKAKLSGIPEEEIIGAWYKRGAAGLGKGFLTEGGTEAVQEMSSAAAEKFVDNNQEFFSSKNLTRFIDAGLKGGLGGGVITGVTDVAFGKAKPQTPEVPSYEDTETALKQILEKEGITLPEGPVEPTAETPEQPAAPEGAPNVEQPISEPSGAGVSVPESTGTTVPTAPRTGGLEPSGVDVSGPDVTEPIGGKGEQPGTVKPSLSKLTKEQLAETWTQPGEATDSSETITYLEPPPDNQAYYVPEVVIKNKDYTASATGSGTRVGLNTPVTSNKFTVNSFDVTQNDTTFFGKTPNAQTRLSVSDGHLELEGTINGNTVGYLRLIDQITKDGTVYTEKKDEAKLRELLGNAVIDTFLQSDPATRQPNVTKILLKKDYEPVFDRLRTLYSEKYGAKPEPGAPSVTETTETKQAEAQRQEAPVTLAPEVQAATDFIVAIDKGGVPLNPAKINKIARDLGLEVSKTAKPEETITRIRAAVERATQRQEAPAAPVVKPTEAKVEEQEAPAAAVKKKKKKEKGPTAEEIETRDLTAEEEAAIEEDPLLQDAVSYVQKNASINEFAEAHNIPLSRAEVLYQEAKNTLEREGTAYSEHDAKLDAKENAGKEPKYTVLPEGKRKKTVTAQGRESRTGRPSIMGGRASPAYVDRELQNGNSRAVLQMVRTGATNPVHRAIAQLLFKSRIFPTIEVVKSLPDGRTAQYNPRTRKVDVTKNALEDIGTLLHEYVHDATIKVIHAYLTGGKLTKEQLQAARHMEFLMKESGGRILNPTSGQTVKDIFPKAYENLYEFVSYGLTNEEFTKVLSRMQIAPDQSYTRTASLWERFVNAVAKLIGFTNEEINALGEKLGISSQDVTKEQLAKEYGGDELALRRANLTPNAMNTEVFSAFMDIIAPSPQTGLELPIMAAVQDPTVGLTTDEATIIKGALKDTEIAERGTKSVMKFLFSKPGAIWLTERFQNDRYRLKRWEDRLELLGLVDRTDEINNVFGQITRSSGIGVDAYHVHLKSLVEDTQEAISKYAEKMGVDTKTALSYLHLIMEVRHEPERRRVKFILKVPLVDDIKSIETKKIFSENKKLTPEQLRGILALFPDTDYSPAAFRDAILVALSSKMNNLPETTRKDYARAMRKALDKVVDDKANHPAITSVTKNGKTTQHKTAPEDFDQGSAKYSVIAGRSPQQIAVIKKVFDKPEVKNEIDQVAKALRAVSDKSIELNRQANYFSVPTQNIVDFYDYDKYVPFKGRPGKEKENDEFDIFSSRIGGEFQEGQDAFGGRQSEADNLIAQVLADGASSALRLGRTNVTLAIRNAVNKKLLPGTITKIPFEDRYLGNTNKQELAGPDKVFHYNTDGTIDVIQIKNKNLSEAIRRQYRESSPIIDVINRFTSGLGMMHTRYNPAFAPLNFVRDALTNAFNLGAEFGPAEAGRLLTQISFDVINGGLAKSLKYAVLYSQGKHSEIEALAKKDPYYKDLRDYVEKGGKVAYLEGVANKGALDKIIEEVGYEQVGPNKIATLLRKKDIDRFLDIYNDMFELASRVATFRTMRETFTSKNIERGMAPDKAAKDAVEHAVEYAKNLANFEQVGRWGKEAGALFMFFRPAATGAVRAVEALAPAFMRFDEAEFRLEAKQSGASDTQIERAVNTMRERRASARKMAAGLAGMGMMIYWAAVMMAGDDDQGRNKVLMDDMERWTRYARFPIPGTDIFFQIPWAFGPGFFSSFGAQLAAMLSGRNSLGDVIGNSIPTFLDSFMPLPVSRISPIENPQAFLIDSALPSAVRPFVEYMINLDGLGREIYNNRQSRYGDAYTGGDNIPETYKIAARTLFNMTDGKIDISPNTLFFFASAYIDGLAKTVTGVANAGMSLTGYKDADLRNDIPVVQSFFGTKSNVDAREFSKVEKQVQEMEKRINSLKDKPEMLERYMEGHANDYALVQFYNQAVNGGLRSLRQAANQIRANPDMTPKERKAELDEIIKLQNAIKRDLLNGFEAVGGLKP